MRQRWERLTPLSSWPIRSFSEAGIRLIDCVHKTPAAQVAGYPYVAIPQMKNGRIDFSDARRISHTDFVEWTKKARPQVHDVVLSRRTNPGVTATFGDEVDFALGQNLVLLRADGTLVNPDFLRWLVVCPDWWAEIEKYNNVGAVFDSLKCADVPNFRLPIPPKPVQISISELLGSMDHKIELNRRMNETLEAMAQAIFRDWFVDFGPVRRKLEGATDPVAIMGGLMPDPARAAELAGLFPDALGGNDLPFGWRDRSVGDLLEPRKGRNITKKTVVAGDVPVVAGGLNPAYYHNTPNVRGPVITISASGANAGFVRLYHQDIWASDCSFISREQTGYIFTIYALLSSRQDEIYFMQQGAAQPHIYASDIKRLVIADAPTPVWKAAENLFAPMFELVANKEREVRTLAETRDYLLPRLMSGEVRVGELEAEVA